MRNIDHIYIDGAFVKPHGTERFPLVNPTTEEVIGHVVLADKEDTQRAIAAAKSALPAFSRTSRAQRIAMLERLHAAVISRAEELRDATIEEYGGPMSRAEWVSQYAAKAFLDAARTLATYEFERREGSATVVMEPVGVSVLVTPWNSNAGSICSKLAMAIAAGCTTVIKPSEMSAIQTQIVAEAFHAADLPAGVINILNGRGDVVGTELSTNPDVARISFTGSTGTGKIIARQALDTMKRVSLALGGKSPTILLDDADFEKAVPAALNIAFQNNGQACIAGSRLLVPRNHLAQVVELAKAAVAGMKVGDPRRFGNDHRPRGQPQSVRPRAGLYQPGPRARRDARSWRRRSSARVGSRLLRQADRVRQCQQRHDHRAGRDLRPRAVHHHLSRRRRRGRHRERFGLRAPRLRVLLRRPARPDHRAPT